MIITILVAALGLCLTLGSYMNLTFTQCLIVVVAIVVLIGVISIMLSNADKKHLDAFIRKCIPDYDDSENWKTYLYEKSGETCKRYCINTFKNKLYIFYMGKELYEERNIKDVIKCELSLNNEIVHSTNRKSQIVGAAVGGVVFGGVGAIIGGLTGTKTSQKGKILEAKILLYYNKPDTPMDVLTFTTGNDIEKVSSEFYATILACMQAVHTGEDVPNDIRLCPFCAEEIKKAAVVCKHCGRDIPQDN